MVNLGKVYMGLLCTLHSSLEKYMQLFYKVEIIKKKKKQNPKKYKLLLIHSIYYA